MDSKLLYYHKVHSSLQGMRDGGQAYLGKKYIWLVQFDATPGMLQSPDIHSYILHASKPNTSKQGVMTQLPESHR